MKKLLSISLSAVLLISSSVTVYAEEAVVSTAEKASKADSGLNKFFLDKSTREKIDRQRESYLNPSKAVKHSAVLPEAKTSAQKPKIKKIYIPPRVSVSAVIKKPDGSTLVRVNNKYNRSPSKHINLDLMHTTTDGIPVTIQGKTKVVPVGSTLLTNKNKLIKSYKLEQAEGKSAIPKTKQVAVKERLDQVQILTPK